VQTENEKAVRDPIAEAIDLLEKSADPFDKACMLLRAALQSQVSNTDGWVMVPVEPTNAMVEAAELDACGRLLADDIADAYSAMLSAAPKAPQQQEQSGEAVQVCPECDIAGCRHIRERTAPTATAEGDVK
jgi:hypothetical protein